MRKLRTFTILAKLHFYDDLEFNIDIRVFNNLRLLNDAA
jgi:hypothetical protein